MMLGSKYLLLSTSYNKPNGNLKENKLKDGQMLTLCSQYRHKKDIINDYDVNQKVKTFYSHPIIRWMVKAIRQKEPMYIGSFCLCGFSLLTASEFLNREMSRRKQ